MKIGSNGFSLAEMLIAMALVGLISTFAIPKIMSANNEEVTRTKLRQTAAALEQAFYDARSQGAINPSQPLSRSIWNKLKLKSKGYYFTGYPRNVAISDNLNATPTPSLNPNCTGSGPFRSLTTTDDDPNKCSHPCCELYNSAPWNSEFDIVESWIEFENGVVITGTYRDNTSETLDNKAWDNATYHNAGDTYTFCIDTNGEDTPNQWGQDVFVGQFNMWGAFTGTPNRRGKIFQWGGRPGENLYHISANTNTDYLTSGGLPIGNSSNATYRTYHVGFYLDD